MVKIKRLALSVYCHVIRARNDVVYTTLTHVGGHCLAFNVCRFSGYVMRLATSVFNIWFDTCSTTILFHSNI